MSALSKIASSRIYEAGEVIVREGEPATGFGLVLSGSAEVLMTPKPGTRVLLGSANPGTALGLSATLDDLPHPVTAIAVSPVKMLLFPKSDLLGLLELHHELWMPISILLSSSVRQAYSWKAQLASRNSRQSSRTPGRVQ